jgi:hypothetical protein
VAWMHQTKLGVGHISTGIKIASLAEDLETGSLIRLEWECRLMHGVSTIRKWQTGSW